MQLQLTKPLVFFDLETTGINIASDRIVEISMIKIHPNGKEERYTQRVNPIIEIPREASLIHGITNEMVLNEPTFKDIATKIRDLIKGLRLSWF
jgi:DNA polymerase-3 subunit epsilon